MTTSSHMPKSDDVAEQICQSILSQSYQNMQRSQTLARDFDELKADTLSFRYALQTMWISQASSQSWTSAKNILRDGGLGSDTWPAMPTLPEPVPPMVKPGIISRLSALADRIKAHRNYTSTIGIDLWLVGGARKNNRTHHLEADLKHLFRSRTSSYCLD